jgi:hypothetical protein
MRTQALVDRSAPDGSRSLTTDLRWVLTTMCAGLVLTVLAAIVPYLGVASDALADHIRAGYPTYSPARIDTAVTTYRTYLSIVGVLGVGGWLWTVRVLQASKPWARGAATMMFLLGTGIALTDLLVKDTSGETGLPAALGWVGILPCLPGLLAITLLWRRQWPVRAPRPRPRSATDIGDTTKEMPK